MKLRLLVGILLLANALFFAWSQGLLRAYGFAPIQQNEPQRVGQQIRPEAVQILSASELKGEEAQAQADLAPKECLQAGPFDEVQVAALRHALESLPAGSWQLNEMKQSARWLVYMGKFANEQALEKKRLELANMNLNLKVETVAEPALSLGISLGGFDSLADANAELGRLNQRGIRTARVVQEREEATQHTLKVPAATVATKASLEGLKSELAGKSLRKCG
jgi:hypothetical protein